MATKPKTDIATKSAQKKLKITLVRSVINTRESHRATVRGLGLRRLNHTVEIEDTPATRGMVNKVGYLLKCED
jgi:large subunit ribosomal protein L30